MPTVVRAQEDRTQIRGRLVTPDGVIEDGLLVIDQDRIVSVTAYEPGDHGAVAPIAGTVLPQGSQSTMLQQELGYWNLGHFTPIQGLTPTTGQPPTYNPTQFTIPLRVRVRALQIKLRIWDQKTNQTRQMTIIQDL